VRQREIEKREAGRGPRGPMKTNESGRGGIRSQEREREREIIAHEAETGRNVGPGPDKREDIQIA